MLLVRFLQSVIALCLIGIVLVLFQTGAASSGRVVFASDYRYPGATDTLNFDNPGTLRLFQSELQSSRPDFYSFKASKGSFLKVRLDILRLPGQDNFRPSLVLFGPGLPPPLESESQQIPFSLPSGAGIQLSAPSQSDIQSEVVKGRVQANLVEEPWTQTSYWERQTLLNEIPQDGTYYLAVFNVTEQSGKYALAIGDKPEAGLAETLTFPVTWVRMHLWFGDWWSPLLAGLLVVLLLGALLWTYLKALGRGIRTLLTAGANQRRRRLLQKRLGPAQSAERRLSPAVKPARSRRYQYPKPAIKPATVSHLVEVKTAPTSAEADAYLLTGSRWEEVALVPALPPTNGHTNGNGNGHQPLTNGHTNGQPPISNGEIKPATDGLSQWGQLHRPKTEAKYRSS